MIMRLLHRLTFIAALSVYLGAQVAMSTAVFAISSDDTKAIYQWQLWAPNLNTCSSSGGTTPGGSVPSASLTDVKTFLSEPVNSTWNIPNHTVEQWFLKQAGAQKVIGKYGLNSGNIGQISAAVQAAGVSPVFFYLDTVNEGGGFGGFINHYLSDTSGGGPGNATRDARYIASQSIDKSAGPATGGDEPADMPTAEAKVILDSLPTGSIGVYYIQATSAVTAELEDLSGKTGDWTGLFGKPVEDMMANITAMGGNPLQGGSTTGGCTGGVTGSGIAKAVSWAVMIAKNNGYGYDQPGRATGWPKWVAAPDCTSACGSFDCSSFIAAALTEAGYFTTNPNFNTMSEASYLSKAGFRNVTSTVDLSTGANMLPGDILLNTADHTAMFIGNGQLVQASINENRTVAGGQVGDQTGTEIYARSYYNFPWDQVWRATH